MSDNGANIIDPLKAYKLESGPKTQKHVQYIVKFCCYEKWTLLGKRHTGVDYWIK